MGIFGSRRRNRREAAEWVARLGGGAGESDHAAFRAWYEADPRNAEAYDRMAAIWSASSQLSKPTAADVAEGGGPSHRLAYAIAASLLLMAAAALLLLRGSFFGTERQGPDVYATSHGELRQIVLPDGSRVMLDAGSRIEVAFSEAERRLVLRDGRARFAVAHEARPFIVQAGASQVVATGTLFDVSLLDHRLSVVLLEGRVEVRQARGSAPPTVRRLEAGNRLVVQGEGAPVSTSASRGDTSWARHMLEFDDVPLGEAVETANRYSQVQIRLADAEIGRLRVTGAYRAGDAAGLARSLAAAFDLELRAGPDGNLTLSRRPPAR